MFALWGRRRRRERGRCRRTIAQAKPRSHCHCHLRSTQTEISLHHKGVADGKKRCGRWRTADSVKRSRQIQKEEEKKATASLPSIKQCHYFTKEEVLMLCEICEKPSTSQSKDGLQIVVNISESTLLDRAQAERDHHGKVGEDPSNQIHMGGPTDKTLYLSKLAEVLTIHVLRFNINDKRSVHVKFEENLDVGEYLNPRSGDRENATYHHVIEHLRRFVQGGHFVKGQEPSSRSLKAQENADVIREIASHLPCEMAIVQMARSGSAWAAALREVGFHVPGAHAKLPWLQMPHPGGPIFYCISCGESGIAQQHIIRIKEDQRWARYVGSLEGLWIVATETKIGGNVIFNLRSGTSFSLPNKVVHGGSLHQLLLLATTLSSAPDKPNCIGMGIIQYMANLQRSRRIVFFTPGSEFAIDHFPGEYLDEPEDLTFHDSSFWFLTTNEHIHRWNAALQPDGDIILETWHSFFFPEHVDHGDYVMGRYIVPSRGEILMVVRLSSYDIAAGEETTRFRIYKVVVVQKSKGEDDPTRCHWHEVSSLDGMLFFIGQGCSRCYEASNYPWLTEAIYFCDGHTSLDAESIVNNLEMPCADNGRWSSQTSINRCFPREHRLSSYSSSGWVLQ